MKNTWLFYIASQVASEGTSYKKLHDTATSPFISCCFTPAENFIHHYWKKNIFHEFSFFHGFIPTSLTTTPPDVQDGFKTMLLQLILLASNQLKVVQTKLLIMHSLPSFEREWVCHFKKKKNLRTNSVDRRNLTKNWEWPKALSKVKSYFVISALNMLFGAFYRLMRPGRLHWNRGNCRICGNFAFPPKPNIYLPL